MTWMQSLSHFVPNPQEPQKKAFEFLKEHGFPTRKKEDWKYTNLKDWTDQSLDLANYSGSAPAMAGEDTFDLVFINGSLENQSLNLPQEIEISQQKIEDQIMDSMQALNSFLSPRTTVITLKKGTQLKKPVAFKFYSSKGLSCGRVKLVLEEKSSVKVLEIHKDLEAESSVSNLNLEIELGTDSQIELVQLQERNETSFHFERLKATCQTRSSALFLLASLGGQLSRSEVDVNLRGSGAQTRLLGLYALANDQQADHYTHIRHVVGGCISEQIYKGLLDGQSRAVFNGGVYIAPNAQKAQSEQLNKNLLLSPRAEVNSKPQLEIFADDVKASHGSTIGQLQKEELFYLLSRGIKKSRALSMLSQAFVQDVVLQIQDPFLRKVAEASVENKIASISGEMKR